MSLSVIVAGKWTPHILIKVVVLSLEIRDCIFKLSITLRLSGLKDPMIQIRCYNLLHMAIWLHFTLVPVSWFVTQRENIHLHITSIHNSLPHYSFWWEISNYTSKDMFFIISFSVLIVFTPFMMLYLPKLIWRYLT